jgi:hypothetical protein
MTDTPRTDEAAVDVWRKSNGERMATSSDKVDADVARKLERELNEARAETIRTREFMDYGFTKAQEELTDMTEQRDRLIKAVEPLKYWRDISECDCSSPLPQGGCLRCDLNRVLKTTKPNEP